MKALRLLAPVLAAAALPAAASDYYTRDFSNAFSPYLSRTYVEEQLRRERSESIYRGVVAGVASQWRYTVDRVPARGDGAQSSWNAANYSPWANAYGTPSTAMPSNVLHRRLGVVSFSSCNCYLPSDAKSWDGGPLTEADIARRCAQQCP